MAREDILSALSLSGAAHITHSPADECEYHLPRETSLQNQVQTDGEYANQRAALNKHRTD